MSSVNLHRESRKPWKRSSAMQSSPEISREKAERSSDTLHGIGSQESFDQLRLSLPKTGDAFSDLPLNDQSESVLSKSVPDVRKRKSRSPSPTALCDDELIRPKPKYNTPQMLSLSPRHPSPTRRQDAPQMLSLSPIHSSPTRRQEKADMKPMKATLKFLDPVKVFEPSWC
jgi:hypothetical protein